MLLSIRHLQRPGLGPIYLDVPLGGCACISGPSGAGKSLLLRSIADLDPNTGTVMVDGVERSRVGYVPAEPAWWDTVPTNHFSDVAEATEITSRLGLGAHMMDQTIETLSTGERQRFALARALELSPSVLMLDEPTGALDEDSTILVEREISAALGRGVAVLLVTHDAAQAERLAHARYTMQPGGILT